MPVTRTHSPRPARQGARLPMLLSAVVYPGAGQLAQGRRLAGLAFILLFSLCLMAFLIAFVTIMTAFYGLGFGRRATSPSLLPLLATFAIALAVYVGSLFDTYMAFVRMRRRDNRRQLGLPPPL